MAKERELYNAVKEGDLATVKHLMRLRRSGRLTIDINWRNPDEHDFSSFVISMETTRYSNKASKIQPEIFKELLQEDDVDFTTCEYHCLTFSLLGAAVELGSALEIVQLIIQDGRCDPNYPKGLHRIRYPYHPLILACSNSGGHDLPGVITALLKIPDIDINYIPKSHRKSPALIRLAASAYHGANCFRALLSDPRTDINIQSSSGTTALHIVVFDSQYESFSASHFGLDGISSGWSLEKLLAILEQPDLNFKIRDNNGKTALDYALDFYNKARAYNSDSSNFSTLRDERKRESYLETESLQLQAVNAIKAAIKKQKSRGAKARLIRNTNYPTSPGTSPRRPGILRSGLLPILSTSTQEMAATTTTTTSAAAAAADLPPPLPAVRVITTTSGAPSLPTPVPSDMRTNELISQDEIALGKVIGGGGYGTVYRAIWRNTEVAVKQLKMGQLTVKGENDFQKEIRLAAKLRHPRIVSFFGSMIKPYAIVMEYMPNGSLYSRLQDNKPLAWESRYHIAADIAAGLTYLHGKNIIHRDMKSFNVLLDINYRAKITDFGLSKVKAQVSSTSTNAGAVGTVLWMAPELFKRKAKHTTHSDMYAFGVILWELSTRELPFQDANGNNALVIEWIKSGDLNEIPSETPEDFSEVIQACWGTEPQQRPCAQEAYSRFAAAVGIFSKQQTAATPAPPVSTASEGYLQNTLPSVEGNASTTSSNNSGYLPHSVSNT